MTDVRPRLVRCFQAVFPELEEGQLPAATQDSVTSWDSVATIMLVNVIDEEFHVQLDLEQLDQLNSFETLRRFLEERALLDQPRAASGSPQ
jgi:acyl carrier protein